jgi:hypothetical protein
MTQHPETRRDLEEKDSAGMALAPQRPALDSTRGVKAVYVYVCCRWYYCLNRSIDRLWWLGLGIGIAWA